MLTKDVDLLVMEPCLFGVWQISHQQRGRGGNGSVSGTAFSVAGGNFINAGVQPGDVVYLASVDGTIDGCYEIVEVVSATQLVVSMVRGDADEPPIPVGSGSNLIWRIATFAPQRALAQQTLLDRLELDDDAVATLSDTSRRQLCTAVVAATRAMIFEAMTQADDDADVFERKKVVYQHDVETVLMQLRLEHEDGRMQRGDTTQMVRK
jgi:hypothetical protein